MSLLTISGVRVSAGSETLVRDLDLQLAPGERVGLIGESGSGKTLTCLSIMSLLPDGLTATGSLRLADVDHELLTASESVWSPLRGARMSMIFQEPMTALNPVMKVGKQVAEMMSLHGESDRRSAERTVQLLDEVGLPDPAVAVHAYPHQLSGGQRQRVMLAMAMANSPDLLLADEPTTALDVTVQAQVLDLMRAQVRDHDSALLFITHDLAVVSQMCERVLIMKDGAVVESGPIETVFARPQHPYTAGLLAASELATDPRTGRLITVPGDQPDPGALNKASGQPPTQDSLSDQPDQRSLSKASSKPEDDQAHDAVRQAQEAEERVFNEVPGDALIRVRDLGRIYHRGRVSLFGPRRQVVGLDRVSFDVAAGARFGIVGESGSGKSTLLRLLCGLDSPTSGSASVTGLELAGASERDLRPLRSQVQLVFQDPHSSLDPRMRVRDVIAEPLRKTPLEVRRARVAEVLQAVGLPNQAADRYPHQFSGGQRQRIAIARALITRPRILLADEPVSALDVSVRAQVLNLLTDLVGAYELTLIFVSHDLNVIRHLCDTVAVMQTGRIVECGPTEQVYADPQHPYTQKLITALPRITVTG
ncbi:ABC transporter ATP-binding protein [Microlunatus elymi]|uniref:ABC transporter ATP-binding protein n=1 Tax=Microlunatus elymi TaxID=2596828 RepID=A0A516PZS8_9ACTN|nr:ABC transporter ATP-binding protein [Microlunatus elymi]QDP96652.1 ABC transporter ATP-binding protein [Microlunatus elymi]